MNGYYQTDGQKEKPPKRKFWQNLLIMDSGDLKKLLSLSSLMMSFVILIIYITAYLLLMPLIDRIIGQGPLLLVNLAESILPAAAATAAVMLTWPLYRDKRVLPAAYLWLLLFGLVLFIGVLIFLRGEAEAVKMFLYIFFWDVVPSLLIGNIAAWTRYRNFLWK